jgi:hypothetical protein
MLTVAKSEESGRGPSEVKMDPYIIMEICIRKPLHKLEVANSLYELF